MSAIPYHHWWNPAQHRPSPPISRVEEAKRQFAMASVSIEHQGDSGIPKLIKDRKRRK